MKIKFILIIFSIFVFSVSFGQEIDKIWTIADKYPVFGDCHSDAPEENAICSNQSLSQYLTENITYPDLAKLEGIQGVVYASFIIDTQGKITNVKILNNIGGNCGLEAKRVLETMPNWSPALVHNRPVNFLLHLPINFSVRNKIKERSDLYDFHWDKLAEPTISKSILHNCTKSKWTLRDKDGDVVPINTIVFEFEKKASYKIVESNGILTQEIKDFIHSLKKGGKLTISMTIQEKGNLYDIKKSYSIN